MYLDRLIFKPKHYEQAEKILDFIKNNYVFYCSQIGIFGVPGTGKSEIAFILRTMLCERGECTKIFHLDDYYFTKPEEREQKRKETDNIGVNEIDWNLLERHTNNNKRHKYGLLIVEGLYAANLSTNNFNILVEGDEEETYDFRLDRGKEDPTDEFRQYVVERECSEINRLKDEFDISLCV
jgi:hypothetical protein